MLASTPINTLDELQQHHQLLETTRDLIYDEYLVKYKKSTIDFDSNILNEHLNESFNLFFFWYDYISKKM